MKYGVYSKDLIWAMIQNISLEAAKSWCSKGQVVCSERRQTTGFSLTFKVTRFWEFRLRPQDGYLNLGFLKINWARHTILRTDKVVWDPEENKESEDKLATK